MGDREGNNGSIEGRGLEYAGAGLPGLTKNLIVSACLASQAGASSVLSQGVDPRNTFYVLNPHSNLSSTEERFRASFSRSGDEGIK